VAFGLDCLLYPSVQRKISMRTELIPPTTRGYKRAEINRKKVESPAKTKSKEMEFPG
jgi:hypothetical protein